MNKKSNRFSPEVRERAVRLVQEHRGEYPSLWACIESIAPTIPANEDSRRKSASYEINRLWVRFLTC